MLNLILLPNNVSAILNVELRLYLIKGSNAIMAIHFIREGEVHVNNTISFSGYFIQIYCEMKPR